VKYTYPVQPVVQYNYRWRSRGSVRAPSRSRDGGLHVSTAATAHLLPALHAVCDFHRASRQARQLYSAVPQSKSKPGTWHGVCSHSVRRHKYCPACDFARSKRTAMEAVHLTFYQQNLSQLKD
jgi:hypothetical protein